MTGEQIVVLVLLFAAFAAGWFARGAGERTPDEADARDDAPSPADEPPPRAAPATRRRPDQDVARPDPAHDAARALAFAAGAYEKAADRWIDERDAITPAGRAAIGELERAVQRLDHAAARLDETDDDRADAAYDALDALRRAARLLEAFRSGRALDGATSRELDRIDDEVARARGAFAAEAEQ